LALLAAARAEDLVLVLLSGGGSALLVDLAPGISLPMLQALTRRLLACGADITAINTVRRRIDRVKGGGLARAGAQTTLRTVILSDVIGNSLTAIASGPTVPNPDDDDDARQVLLTAGINQQVDPAILAACGTPITRQPVAQTPIIIADISQSLAAAGVAARAAGYEPTLVSATLTGDATHAGTTIAALLRALPPSPQPRCLLWGGETTVTLGPQHGHGGRNQTVALAIAQGIAGAPDALVAAYATDGGDGPTDAAGAVVTATTWSPAARVTTTLTPASATTSWRTST
jgi:hydroxypyruvate reductase